MSPLRCAVWKTYPMLTSAGINALDPQSTHVTLLVAPIPVCILQGFLDALPRRANAVLAAPSEALGELQNLLVVHLRSAPDFSSSYTGPVSAISLVQVLKALVEAPELEVVQTTTTASSKNPKP